eukprot:gene34004-62850_t
MCPPLHSGGSRRRPPHRSGVTEDVRGLRKGTVDVLRRLLDNLRREPRNPVYRKVNEGNPTIARAVVGMPYGVTLLRAVGFASSSDAGARLLIIPDGSDPTEVSAAASRAVAAIDAYWGTQCGPQNVPQPRKLPNGGVAPMAGLRRVGGTYTTPITGRGPPSGGRLTGETP